MWTEVKRAEQVHPSALGHCESTLPWGPEDTRLSARSELQGGPRIARYPASMQLGALP